MSRPMATVLTGLAILAGVLGLTWMLQRRLMYFPFGDVPTPDEVGLAHAEPVTFTTSPGDSWGQRGQGGADYGNLLGWLNCLSVSSPEIHQFWVVLCGVSPLVWRRLLVTSDTSLAELHDALQIAFDWSGEHVHRFRIHGKGYGIPQWGGSAVSSVQPRRKCA